MDLNRCDKCGLALIHEEVLIHECKSVIDYRFEDDILWMFDGEFWIPRKSKQPTGNKEKTTDNETEPEIRYCQVLGSYLKLFSLSSLGSFSIWCVREFFF
ncbi:MAG: hypothetical protein K8Q88_07980 [Nitrosarchaeum sp.]|nr:hypothetical protein [Nitrosarchaeum sp.]